MVINLSFHDEIVRADIIAGTAHAAPLNKGIIDLPFKPTPLRSLSVIKLTRAIYPVSSRKAIKANKNATIKLEKSKIEKEKEFLMFQKELNNSYETYKNNLFILDVQEQSLNTSKNNFLRNSEKYDIGIVSSIEFRNAQINLLNANLSRNTARYDAKISELIFLKLSGQIISNSF